MKFNFNVIKMGVQGESHSRSVDMTIQGLPVGTTFDVRELQEFMGRRQGDGSFLAELCRTGRREPDIVIFDEGIEGTTSTDVASVGAAATDDNGALHEEADGSETIIESDGVHATITGDTIRAHIDNKDFRSGDYANLRTVLRPGHADLGAYLKFGPEGLRPGGGPFSGRLTAANCFAGGIAKQILEQRGIKIVTYILQIAGMNVQFLDEEDEQELIERIAGLSAEGDSCGGIVGCRVTGFPGGIGGPGMEGLEGDLARAMLAIPSVKGVEFGSGFEGACMTGSWNNDDYFLKDGRIVTRTNKQGGIAGGISTGMNITMNVAFKPVPSLSLPQRSVDIEKMEEVVMETHGRHDVCVIPRALPVVEAMAALALLDRLLEDEIEAEE